MRDISREGLYKKYGQPSQTVLERYEYEMNMIEKMGYVDYYLIVWDYIHFAKTHDIMVGPGRGSGAGSIVAYAMDITTVDPIKYNFRLTAGAGLLNMLLRSTARKMWRR